MSLLSGSVAAGPTTVTNSSWPSSTSGASKHLTPISRSSISTVNTQQSGSWSSDRSTAAYMTAHKTLSQGGNLRYVTIGPDQSSDPHFCSQGAKKNPDKVVLFADSHDTLFQGGTAVCPSSSDYAEMYWNHEADVIFQADGVRLSQLMSCHQCHAHNIFNNSTHHGKFEGCRCKIYKHFHNVQQQDWCIDSLKFDGKLHCFDKHHNMWSQFTVQDNIVSAFRSFKLGHPWATSCYMLCIATLLGFICSSSCCWCLNWCIYEVLPGVGLWMGFTKSLRTLSD